MALKRTSEPFIISTEILESAANTFTQSTIQVNLNPLDQEVLLILAVDIDAFAPDVVTAVNTRTNLSVSTSSQTGVIGIGDSACTSSLIDYIGILATNNFFLQTLGVGNLGAKGGNVRMWAVRAKADSATYAALVNSELLSA